MKISQILYSTQNQIGLQSSKYSNREYQKQGYNNLAAYYFEDTQTFLSKFPNFKAKPLNSNLHLNLTEDETKPCFIIQIKTHSNFQEKQGIAPIYEIALRNKIQEEMQKNPVWKESDTFLNGLAYQINFYDCKDLNTTVRQARNMLTGKTFNNNDIASAKELAQAAYKLYLHNSCKEYDFSDIPVKFTEQEYRNLIEPITLSDIKKYNDTLINNSNAEITLIMNKDEYYSQKDKIQPLMNNIF